MSLKTISILIPVLNGGDHFKKCLASVCAQDTEVHEYVIVDNNSTDNSKEIIKEFQKTHPNMHYVFESVRTRGAARNAGLARVTGDIVVMTDADCIVPVDWVRRLTAPIRSGEEAVTTGYQYNLLPNNYWARETQRKCDYFLKMHNAGPGYITFTDTKNLAITTVLLKENVFDSRFKALEDVDLELQLRPLAHFRYLPDVQVGHAHSSSLKAVWNMGYERSYWYAQLYHKYKGVKDSNGVLIFEKVSPFHFYTNLLKINIEAIKVQGIVHIPFFIVFDLAWKVGSAIGFAHIDKRMR
jgi:glycosyltransferase involved in cell wall biosynthesis